MVRDVFCNLALEKIGGRPPWTSYGLHGTNAMSVHRHHHLLRIGNTRMHRELI